MSVPGQSLTEVSVLPVTDALAWVVVAVFLSGVVADWSGRRELARRLTVGAWVGFSVFWLLLIHQFALVHRSIIQTVLVVVAVPMCLYVARTLLQGRDSLLVLSRAVARQRMEPRKPGRDGRSVRSRSDGLPAAQHR